MTLYLQAWLKNSLELDSRLTLKLNMSIPLEASSKQRLLIWALKIWEIMPRLQFYRETSIARESNDLVGDDDSVVSIPNTALSKLFFGTSENIVAIRQNVDAWHAGTNPAETHKMHLPV